MKRIKLDIVIPKDILNIHEIFKINGFELFLVGGCVRDSILKIKPKDWDLVTNAEPEMVIQLLNGVRFVTNIMETGKHFGVINIITKNDEFEIATMREDIGSGRKPESVKFTNMETDVLRRDLSCNALFFDIDSSEIVDLVGGIEDIKNGVVKTVGKAEDRFAEDRLRILRVIRFAARFGSGLDPSVEAALKSDASLDGISPERIRDEFLKGVKTAKSVKQFLELNDRFNLFDWIFKGLDVSKDFSSQRDPAIALATILRGNDPSTLGKVLNKLTYSANEVKAITFLVSMQQFTDPTAVVLFKKQHNNSGVSNDQLKSFAVLAGLNGAMIDTFANFELSVTGDDVAKLGIKAGPEMGQAIKKMEGDNFSSML